MKNNLLIFFTTGLLIAASPTTVAAAMSDKTQINVIINVATQTCSFDNTSPMFSLTEISTAKFRNSGSAIVGWKDIDIDIQCGSGIDSVRIVPTGTPATGDETAFANTGSARNVGLRFMAYQGTSILYPDGSASVTVSSSGGTGSYRFRAGYVATGGPVRAGDFMAVVNLSFDYS